MNTFRRAPVQLKLLLLLLPIALCLKLFGFALGVRAVAASNQSLLLFLLPLGMDVISIAFVAAVAWSVWHPRPQTRWFVAIILLLLFAQNIYLAIYPSVPPVQIPRIPVDENRMGYQFGLLFCQILSVWWVYICVFARRSLEFFGCNVLSNDLPIEFHEVDKA